MDALTKIPKVPTVRQLKKAGIDIAVYVPLARAGVLPEPFWYLWQIARQGWDFLPIESFGRTDVNRNRAGHWMRENDRYTHLLMLDADHKHEEDIVLKHARWVLEDKSRLVIGSLNFRRTLPFDACLFQPDGEGKLYPMEKWPKGLISTPLMGHGSILISRKVFEKVDPPWWGYPYNFASKGEYPAEDSHFCFNMVRHEIDMWCDTTITSPHLTGIAIDENSHKSAAPLRAKMREQANES